MKMRESDSSSSSWWWLWSHVSLSSAEERPTASPVRMVKTLLCGFAACDPILLAVMGSGLNTESPGVAAVPPGAVWGVSTKPHYLTWCFADYSFTPAWVQLHSFVFVLVKLKLCVLSWLNSEIKWFFAVNCLKKPEFQELHLMYLTKWSSGHLDGTADWQARPRIIDICARADSIVVSKCIIIYSLKKREGFIDQMDAMCLFFFFFLFIRTDRLGFICLLSSLLPTFKRKTSDIFDAWKVIMQEYLCFLAAQIWNPGV